MNLKLDPKLIEKAMKLGGHRTGKSAVTEAHTEYVHYREQLKILDLAGTVDHFEDYDYKKLRRCR